MDDSQVDAFQHYEKILGGYVINVVGILGLIGNCLCTLTLGRKEMRSNCFNQLCIGKFHLLKYRVLNPNFACKSILWINVVMLTILEPQLLSLNESDFCFWKISTQKSYSDLCTHQTWILAPLWSFWRNTLYYLCHMNSCSLPIQFCSSDADARFCTRKLWVYRV